jgi:hypothetical protein
MTYRIAGLESESFRHLIGAEEEVLSANNARRVVATSDTGFPCRVSLEDAKAGEPMLLLNHVSLDGATPFRTTYAIYVRETEQEPRVFEDEVPPALHRRMLGLRSFDRSAMLVTAALCAPGEADAAIRELLARHDVAQIHAHNPAYGCFLARIERYGAEG